MKLIIPYKIESLNVVLRKHWSYRGKVKKQLIKDLWAYAMGDRYVKGRVFKKLTIISRRKRLIDQDNLCAKMLIDAIKELGWIADDSVAKCDITVRQIKSNEHDTCIELR